MPVHFRQTSSFEAIRSNIENHLYRSVLEIEKNSNLALRSVSEFARAIDRLMSTLEQMYQNPRKEETEGEKSFPICRGRYRVFFKVHLRTKRDFDITFLDIDDNKQSNLDRFPDHKIISFESSE